MAKCHYSHQIIKSAWLHWAVYAELLRRGGHRRARRTVDVNDIDCRVNQLSESNASELGEKIDPNGRTGKTVRPTTPDPDQNDSGIATYSGDAGQGPDNANEGIADYQRTDQDGDEQLAAVGPPEVSTSPRSNPWAKDHPSDID